MPTGKVSTLDGEGIVKQFDKIDDKVSGLIQVCRTLEISNQELRQKVQLLEEELRQQSEAEARHQEEKGLIRDKIDGLLARLEELSEPESPS
jgi:transcriptional regulator NrdR family protein